MARLEQLVDRVAAAVWNLHPQWAVAAGRHEYDRQVPDLSAAAIEAGLDRLVRLRSQVQALEGLDASGELDRAVLLRVVDRQRFEAGADRRWERDPGWYLAPLDVSVYLERDYGPVGLRLERAATVLGGTAEVLAAARANLQETLPPARVEQAVLAARAQALRVAAQAAWAPGAAAAPAEAAWLREAAGGASAELEAYADWIEAERRPRAAGGDALCREYLEGWLQAGEGLSRSAEDLAAVGAARLGQDREALAAEAAALAPGLPWEEACRRAAAAGPPADPVAALAGSVEGARRFVADRGLVPLSGVPTVKAAAGPGVPVREAGRLQPPGAYDDPATAAVIIVESDPGGGRGRARLDELAVGAAFPGRLVAVAAAAAAPGEARRRFASPGFLEGWALYGGDLMAEAGFREEAAGWRLLWRHRVVVADCRLSVLPRLYAGDLSPEQAVEAFVGEAGLQLEDARAEVRRGRAGPGGLAGALGRAEILDWRGRVAAGGAGPGARHDRLLAEGALPLGLLGRVAP